MQRRSWAAHAVDQGHSGHARALAVRALVDWPELARAMRADRAFLRRAVRHLAGRGIDQFLDLGAGVPTVGDVREVARATSPEARVVGVDVDSTAVANAARVLADDPRAGVLHADARDVAAVLDAPATRALLDPDRALGVVAVGWVHFVPDDGDPAAMLGGYRDALAPGSHLVLTHAGADEEHAGAGDDHDTLYRRTRTPIAPRSVDEVTALLAGYEIVEPGVVPVARWRPDDVTEDVGSAPGRFTGYAAVGRRV